MLIATTSERYDSEAGAQFLRHLAEEDYVSKATESLLDSGVFTKTQHEAGRLRPGRPFRLSDALVDCLLLQFSAHVAPTQKCQCFGRTHVQRNL
jgi:hypothetical protein